MDRTLQVRARRSELRETSHGAPLKLEAWRILDSAKMLFHGMDIDPGAVTSYTEFFTHSVLSTETLPVTITAFCKKSEQQRPLDPFLHAIVDLLSVVLAFAHVVELDKCADLPLKLVPGGVGYSAVVNDIIRLASPDARVIIMPDTAFEGLTELLVDPFEVPSLDGPFTIGGGYRSLFLESAFGWSVYYDTAGFPDPTRCRPELLHVKRGTPTNRKTGERKHAIRDGTGLRDFWSGPGQPVSETGETYTPRCLAHVSNRTEYWASQAHDFELTHFMHVEPIAELKENKPFQVMFTYRLMLDLLWTTYTTPPCPHDIRKRTALPQPPLKLGPDAAVLLNCWDWLTNDHRIEDSDDESAGPRIWICLTFGSPGIRWVAIDAAENNGMIHDEFRDIMLRSDSCCADCALEHVALHEGRWILIL